MPVSIGESSIERLYEIKINNGMPSGEQDSNSGPDFVTVNDLPIEWRCEMFAQPDEIQLDRISRKILNEKSYQIGHFIKHVTDYSSCAEEGELLNVLVVGIQETG